MSLARIPVYIELLGRVLPLGKALISDLRQMVTSGQNEELLELLDHLDQTSDAIVEKAKAELAALDVTPSGED